MPQLDFDHDEHETGGSKRPTKIVLKGLHPETGEQVGHLTYLVPRRKADKILVDRLEVEPQHKGNGFAGQLMDEMQARHPGTPIDHGSRTDEGAQWWKAYTRGKSVQRGRTIARINPDPILHNRVDDAFHNAELVSESDLFSSGSRIASTDFGNLDGGESRMGVSFANGSSMAGLPHHVGDVVGLSAVDEVVEFDAGRRVASVPQGVRGPRSVGQKPCHTVGQARSPFVEEDAVPLSVRSRSPQQTSRGVTTGLSPKSIHGSNYNRSMDRTDDGDHTEIPPPYPNPRAEFREGGPDGTHWYHGTAAEPFEGPLKPTEHDYGHASVINTHWNTALGPHFSSSHDLARDFARNFAGADSATPEHARIAHATLHMRNPADFENEHELADHAIRTARKHGLPYGETDDPELKDINDGYEDEVDLAHKDHWINSHPHREQIVHHVEDDLRKAGHDGILYGNSYEGTPGHTSAIAFRDTPVAVHHWEHLHEGHPNHGRTAARKPTLLYHGTAADKDPETVEPGPDGYAYASKSPLHALWHAQAAAAETGGEPHVYEVKHLGRPADLGEHPGEQHAWRSAKGFRVLRRSPIGIVPKENHVREAGKGKPRRDAPELDRRAPAQAEGRPEDLAPDPGGDADGRLKALVEHPRVGSDLRKLPRQIQAAYRSRVDDLRRGSPHSSTHALSGPLKGWQSTSLNFQYRVVHKHVGDELHVLSAGNHDESYEQGARRTAKEGRYTAPRERLFGRTYGLDKRIWDGETLKEPVRADILATFDRFCTRHGLSGHERWAKVVFFGSEASNWSGPQLRGNGDFDLSIGLHYDRFRAANPAFADDADAEIADSLTRLMHLELNDPQHRFPGGVEGTWDETWFCNLLGWSIEKIKPYAAWDVTEREWIVRPPDLPDWSMAKFPEGPGAAEEVRGIIEMAEGILAMPEPYRTQNGSALWEFVHSNRSDAFGPNGEGWWDMRNVVEKAIDQHGLMQPLFECHRRAVEHPESLAAPADWSNSPA